jgi:hypothetical protein
MRLRLGLATALAVGSARIARAATGSQVLGAIKRPAAAGFIDVVNAGSGDCAARQANLAGVAVAFEDEDADGAPAGGSVARVFAHRWPSLTTSQTARMCEQAGPKAGQVHDQRPCW